MNRSRPAVHHIFVAFLKLGLTAFGGPAMVGHIRETVVVRHRWLDASRFNEGIAFCQLLPGAVAVNTAAYAGYRIRGLAGLLAAAAAFILPAFLLLLLLSALYSRTRSLPTAGALFAGLAVVVVAIVVHAAASFARRSLKGPLDSLVALTGALLLAAGLSPFLVIVGAGLAGIVLFRRQPADATLYPAAVDSPQTAWHNALTLASAAGALAAVLAVFASPLFELLWLMGKIELFAFGGGYTALTLMFHELVTSHALLDHQTLVDGIALGQLTPGPILITATFVGFLRAGLSGAAIATIGVFLPGLVLITALLPLFDRLHASPFVPRILRGIVACFVGLLAAIACKLALAISWDLPRVLLAFTAGAALFGKIDLLWVIVFGAIFSVLLF